MAGDHVEVIVLLPIFTCSYIYIYDFIVLPVLNRVNEICLNQLIHSLVLYFGDRMSVLSNHILLILCQTYVDALVFVLLLRNACYNVIMYRLR